MAFIPVEIDREDAPQLTQRGLRSVRFPNTPTRPVPNHPTACGGCSKIRQHSIGRTVRLPIRFGETRYSQFGKERILAEDGNRIQGALSVAWWAFNGFVPLSVPWNVGNSANNATQVVNAQLFEVSGDRVRCAILGGNPGKFDLGESIENPDWPGEGPRLLTRAVEQSLPRYAAVEFDPRSAAGQKRRPLLLEVESVASAGTDAHFWAKLSCDATGAMSPADRAFTPERYYIDFLFPAFSPPVWQHLPVFDDGLWTRRVRAFDAPGILVFADTKVLYWRGCPPSVLSLRLSKAGVVTTITGEPLTDLLTTVQGPSAWAVVIDLRDFDFDVAVLNYIGEATADTPPAAIFPFQAQCQNSQPAMDYASPDEGNVCWDRTASRRRDFVRRCWLPDCSGFSIQEAGVGNSPVPASDFGDGDFWSSLWSRNDWIVAQDAPGSQQSRLERPGGSYGPSVMALAGGFHDAVPTGAFRTKLPLDFPLLGQREQWEDDGDKDHGIIGGALFAKAHDFSGTGGPTHAHDAAGIPKPGAVVEAADGWRDGKPGVREGIDYYPVRGIGATNLYEYDHQRDGLGLPQQRLVDADPTAAGLDLSAVDEALASSARAAFGVPSP